MARKNKRALAVRTTNAPGELEAAQTPKKRKRRGNKMAWKVLGNSAGLASAYLTTKALNTGWRAAVGRKPPTKPESPELAQREALAWSAVSGAAMALMKTYATRRAAGYWIKSTGSLPPGFLDEKKKKKRARLF